MEHEELIATMASGSLAEECPGDGETAVLWALCAARKVAQRDDLTASEVAAVVTRLGRLSMSRQAAQGHLARLPQSGAVHRYKRRNRPDAYSIMGPGEERITDTKGIVLVDPARALREVRDLESVLEQLKGAVTICAPYLDSRSLDFIGCIRNASSIRVLTERVAEEEKVKRELNVVERQIGTSVEVRRAPKGLLHDRYIIDDGGMLVLGTSLNSFGLKQSFVSRVGHDVRAATRTFFSEKWVSATPLAQNHNQ
jgi:hypothetical protein